MNIQSHLSTKLSRIKTRTLIPLKTFDFGSEPLMPLKLLYGFDVTALPYHGVDPEELEDEDFSEQDQLSKALKRLSLLFLHFVQRFKNEYLASLRERHMYPSKKRGTQEEVPKSERSYLYTKKMFPAVLGSWQSQK